MLNIRFIIHKLTIYFATGYFKLFGNIKLKRNVIFKGFPNILKDKYAIIEIGENTIINSSNYGYHLNMHSSCKLYADRPNSIIKIGENCRIHGTCIHAFKSITIGNNCLIAANTQIMDGNGHSLNFDKPENRINTTDEGKSIIIEDSVWIGANCIVLGGTIIGKGCVIAAGSIVKAIIPPNCLYGGNPGKIIKQF